MGNFFKVVGSALLGFAAGAAVTLLLSPRSGQEVQSSIRGRVDAAVEEGRAAQEAKRAELERQAGLRPL